MAENQPIIRHSIGEKLILCGLFEPSGSGGRNLARRGRPKID